MTRRSIEETAAAILDLYRDHRLKFIAVGGCPRRSFGSGAAASRCSLASTSSSPAALLLRKEPGLPVETEAPGVDERGVEAAAGWRSRSRAPADASARRSRRRRRRWPSAGADRPRRGRRRPGARAATARLFHKPADAARRGAQLVAPRRAHAPPPRGCRPGAGRRGPERRAFETPRLAMRPLRVAAASSATSTWPARARRRSVGGYQLEGSASTCSSGSRATTPPSSALPLLPLLAALRSLGLLVM